MFLSCGVGAAITVEEREIRETAMNAEIFILNDAEAANRRKWLVQGV